jgi:Ca2+-binding RTX toxin-like protein
VTIAGGRDVVAMGDGVDTLVINWAGATDYHFDYSALSGSLTEGYSGAIVNSGNYGHRNRVDFSGVEHFQVTLGVGADSLHTGNGDDIVSGGAGGDFLWTEGGADKVTGGNDLDGSRGGDRWYADKSAATAGMVLDLTQGVSTYLIDGRQGTMTGIEALGHWDGSAFLTGSGADTITTLADFHHDYINTGAGNDRVTIAAGRDGIDMGAGNDTLVVDWSGVTYYHFDYSVVSGTLATGYSGAIVNSGNYGDRNRVDFAGVEHFDIKVGLGYDFIRTGDGNDRIGGGGGNDTLDAGGGSDVADYSDKSVGVAVTLNGANAVTAFVGGVAEDTLYNFEGVTGGSAADTLMGDAGDNILSGGGGDDNIEGAAGNDVLDGGVGIDTLSYASATAGVTVNLSNLLAQNTGGAGTDKLGGFENLIGSASADTLTGDAAANLLNGGKGADTMTGGAGNDTYIVDNSADKTKETAAAHGIDTVEASVSFTLTAYLENLILTGVAAANGTGNELANTITGNSAANLLNGGLGADTLKGGLGNDTYMVDDKLDKVEEASGAGTDTVQASVTYVLSTNLENLTLAGLAAINGTGNGADNVITGNGAINVISGGGGNDRLDGGAGADSLTGGAGNDTFVVDNVGDKVVEAASGGTDTVESSINYTLGADVENLKLGGVAAINGTGNGLANSLTGNSAANVLNGLGGADTMTGAAGNDTYVVDNAGDKAIETASTGGTDLVQSGVDFMLGNFVENLTLTGAALNGTGNSLANLITGNSAANILDGLAGADTMDGAGGNDTYVVDDTGDKAAEASATGGTDLVRSSVSFTLGNNIENLTLTGSGAVNATGNGLANALTGNAGANILDGLAGADTMVGGAGDDTYAVDNVGDKVTEAASGGTDTVRSAINYTLAAQLENLVLTGAAAINATGNGAVNALTGNAASNLLDGMAGADTMTGGAGDDTYVVDNVGDKAVEKLGGGIDLVQSTVTYTLGAEVENLTLKGTAAVSGTGNGLANMLTGNDAVNTLTGGAGNDTLDGGGAGDKLVGGSGDDTYVVDALDSVTEAAAGGTDTIHAAISYTLGAEVENLVLTGASAINGTGNALNNSITGNGAVNSLLGGDGLDSLFGGLGNDMLDGGTGADKLYGGLGVDKLTGGTGADGFYFDSALNAVGNVDAIKDFAAVDDTIFLNRSVFTGITVNGALASTAFAAGTAALDGSDRIVYDKATGKIFYDADGNGAGAAVLFATVNAGTVLTNADFSAYTG